MSLERRLEALEQRVAILENGLVGIVDPLALRFKLSMTLAQILAILLKRKSVTVKTLYDLIYGGADDAPEFNTIRVQIHHLRGKLKPFGIIIKNGWQGGYSIHPAHQQIIKKHLANAAVLESAAVSDPAPDHSRRGGVVSCQGGEQWEPMTRGATRKKKSSGGTLMLD